MGTLFSTLDIARSGLQASQTQIDVAAHNIANVNTVGYSRQRAELSARWPTDTASGQIGRGVQVDRIARIRDTFLDTVYRVQAPNLGSTEIQAQYYTRIEDLFLEPSEQGFGTRLNEFFDALYAFANTPESMPSREAVIAQAGSISSSLQEMGSRLFALRTNANEQIEDIVPEMNVLAKRIATLNDNIRISESGGNPANDLRDERDRLVDELSSYVNISTRERIDGQLDVLVGDDLLVNGIYANELEAAANPTMDPERSDLVEVRFKETGLSLDVRSGELYGLLTIRDSVIPELDGRIDSIASGLIEEINRIHSQGSGLQNLSGTITGSNAVTGGASPLTSAGLPFSITPGSFDVVVYDAAGNPTSRTINITAATTLNSLAADLSAVPNFSASVTADGTLQLGATGGRTFSFRNDSSGALTALGVNGLFTGHDARSIGVNQALIDNPAWLTSHYTLDPRDTGNGAAAIAMGDLRSARLLDGDTASINDYYEASIARLGVAARTNLQIRDVEQAFVDDFERRRMEVSGVSIDEEVTFMIQFQRAFEASARVIGVVDSMLDTLINATR